MSRTPRYYLVKRHLLEQIDAAGPGAPVPTERQLAAELGTSRTTVRQALTELAAEGRVVRRHGSGTYVADAKLTWPQNMSSFTEQARANGMVPSSRLLSATRGKADDTAAVELELAIGAPVYTIDRLRLADGNPIVVERSVLPATRFPRLSTLIQSAESLHALLTGHYGVDLWQGDESIETAPASPEHAALLQVDAGAPLLVVRRRVLGSDHRPVESGTSRFRGDRVTLVTKLGPD